MSSCFVCGSICLPDYKTIGYEKFFDIVYDFIHENNIDKIYCCFRNDFDYIIKEIFDSMHQKDGIEFVPVFFNCNLHSRDMSCDDNFNYYYPFKEDVKSTEFFSTLYGWMIDNSDYMLTFIADDSDISYYIKKQAVKNKVKVYNLLNKVDRKKLFFTS